VSLQKKIAADMKQAMRAKDATRLDAVRLLRAEIQRREIDEKKELDDNNVLSVIQKIIKQGHDSIRQFEKGGRHDLVEKELTMVRVLETYVPDALSEIELRSLIDKTLTKTNAKSMKDMGSVMNALKAEIQGRANMSDVSKIVQEKLQE